MRMPNRAGVAIAWLLPAFAGAQSVEAFDLTAGVQDHQSEAALTYLPDADAFVALWADERSGTLIDLYADVIAAGAAPAGEFFVSDQGSDQNVPFAALDAAAGDALVVFRDSRGYPYDIYGQWLDVAGATVTPTGTATSVNFAVQASGGLQDVPRVAFGGGAFLVVVEDQQLDADLSATCSGAEGSCGDVVAFVFAAGATTPTATTGVTTADKFQRTPAVAWDEAASSFLVAWADWRNDADQDGSCDEGEGSCADVMAQAIDATGTLVGGEIAVTSADGDQEAPDLAEMDGEVLAVWEDRRDPGGTGWDVWARRLAAGTPEGDEFAVAVVDSIQRAPRVAACADDGRFVVAFQDNRAGALAAIWAQAIDADGTLYGVNFAVAPAPGNQTAPAVACGGGVAALVWTDWRNVADPGPDGTAGTFDDPVSDVYGAFVTIDEPPDNPPQAPENVTPSPGAVDIALGPALAGSEFYDIDGDDHASSRWEICADEACDDVVYDSGDAGDLTSHEVPGGTLDIATTYWWRVRYTDDPGRASAPSEPTSFTTVLNQPPATPQNVSPADGAGDVSTAPTLTASKFSDPDGDEVVSSEWQVCTDAYCTNLPVAALDVDAPLEEFRVEPGQLDPQRTYLWRVRYQDARGGLSEWSEPTSFSTREEHAPDRPTNTAPADGATDEPLEPMLGASAFSDPDGDEHLASEWAVCLDAECLYAIYQTGTLAGAETNHAVAAGALRAGNLYYWRVRYQDSTGRFSEWSAATTFTTVPGEAPAAEGDDGCGCAVGGREERGAAWWILALALGARLAPFARPARRVGPARRRR